MEDKNDNKCKYCKEEIPAGRIMCDYCIEVHDNAYQSAYCIENTQS